MSETGTTCNYSLGVEITNGEVQAGFHFRLTSTKTLEVPITDFAVKTLCGGVFFLLKRHTSGVAFQ